MLARAPIVHSATPRSPRSKRLLIAAFGTVALLLVLAEMFGYLEWRRVHDNIDLVEHNALASIRLIQRIGLDVERERILVDRHIFEHDSSRMRELELQIAAVRHDYATAAHTYVPLSTFAGEPEAWAKLARDVDALAPRITEALASSSRNADAEAQSALAGAEPAYDAVDRDVTALVAINQHAAEDDISRVDDLQLQLLTLRLALAAVALALIVLLGLAVTRVLGRREAQIVAHSVTLENRNRELDAFAGRVAHDLRGPLNTIKLSGSMLAEGLPAETRTALILQRGVSQMEQLIEDLLTLSRLDSQPVGVVGEVENVASSLAEELERVVREAGGTLAFELAPAHVRCSEGMLRQVLWNLGENAVKYRRLDEPLALSVTGTKIPGEYAIEITDNGSGMSPDDAQSAFEPFYRGHHARPVPGTGLGLSIVRRIVEAHGGAIALTSAKDRGTTVRIRLPRAS